MPYMFSEKHIYFFSCTDFLPWDSFLFLTAKNPRPIFSNAHMYQHHFPVYTGWTTKTYPLFQSFLSRKNLYSV